MATTRSQRRWRNRFRTVKTQLNVMATRSVHDGLAEVAARFDLRGKGEAVAFCCVVTRALVEMSADDERMRRVIDDLAEGYQNSREIHAAS